jgi:magnesium transporter
MIVDCAHYVDGVPAAEPANLGDAGRLACQAEGFVWVALNDPMAAELDELALAFGVPRSALQRSPEEYRRPKLEHHGETTVLTVKSVRREGAGTGLIEIGAVDILIGGHHVIAIGQSSRDAVEGACARLQAGPDVATHGPMAAVWAVLDAVIEGSARVVDALGDELDTIQVAVFRSDQDQSESIYVQLVQAGRFARAMHPMLAIFDELERGELVEVPPALSPLLGDLSDQARRLSEEVLMLTQALDGLLNANVARVTVRQNVIIQQVSAWAAIAAVATIITGIYGMNFRHMPELGWVFGYPFAIAIMIATVVVLRWYFKRAGWL